jgi:hypothetical protein
MANYSFFDVGQCNCGCLFAGCIIPAANLTFNYNNVGAAINVSTPLVYTAPCKWDTGCFLAGGFSLQIKMQAGPTCSFILQYNYPVGCGGVANLISTFDSPTGCAGGGAMPAFTCSPLFLQWRTGISPFVFWTITYP